MIVGLDDREVASNADLGPIMDSLDAGQEVTVDVVHADGNEEQTSRSRWAPARCPTSCRSGAPRRGLR